MNDSQDLVRIISGRLIDLDEIRRSLTEAGIDNHLVGGDLDGGIGTAPGNEVELWVKAEEAERATSVARECEQRRGQVDVGDSTPQVD